MRGVNSLTPATSTARITAIGWVANDAKRDFECYGLIASVIVELCPECSVKWMERNN